jgi:hypothetical protein
MSRLLFDGKSSESEFQALSIHWQVEWVWGIQCSYSDCFEDPELYFDVDGCFF